MIVNKRVIIGALAIVLLITLYGFLSLSGISYQRSLHEQATAYITIVAPETIPTQDFSFLFLTPTSTADPALGNLKGIAIGKFVQISGTEGAGLKIREQPGTSSSVKFIANETEAFQVQGGPIQVDGLVWWQLVTPYDSSRQGWAAADYLTLIDQQ